MTLYQVTNNVSMFWLTNKYLVIIIYCYYDIGMWCQLIAMKGLRCTVLSDELLCEDDHLDNVRQVQVGTYSGAA